MKPIEQTGHAIRAILTAATAVTAIVGDKIRPNVAGPMDAAPYIIYKTQGTPIQSKDGSNTTARILCSIECYHTDVNTLQTLMAAVRLALDGQSGNFNAVEVQKISFDDEQGFFEDTGGIEGLYMHLHDYMVWVNASGNGSQVPPQFAQGPIIYGNTIAGSTLTVLPGIVTGSNPIIRTYQWYRDGVSITGQTATSYVLTLNDEGTDITCIETATGITSVTDQSNILSIGLKKEKQQSFVSPYSYCGIAPNGALVTDETWVITRILINIDGTTTTAIATNVNWINYLTHTYT